MKNTYLIRNMGTHQNVYYGETWIASFCSQSDAEAWVASKRECVPLPEPTKHRCRRKSDGAEFSFCVMPCTDIAFIFLSNWERWSEKDFRAAFDILPECE